MNFWLLVGMVFCVLLLLEAIGVYIGEKYKFKAAHSIWVFGITSSIAATVAPGCMIFYYWVIEPMRFFSPESEHRLVDLLIDGGLTFASLMLMGVAMMTAVLIRVAASYFAEK